MAMMPKEAEQLLNPHINAIENNVSLIQKLSNSKQLKLIKQLGEIKPQEPGNS